MEPRHRSHPPSAAPALSAGIATAAPEPPPHGPAAKAKADTPPRADDRLDRYREWLRHAVRRRGAA